MKGREEHEGGGGEEEQEEGKVHYLETSSHFTYPQRKEKLS